MQKTAKIIALFAFLLVVGVLMLFAKGCDSYCAESFISFYYLPVAWSNILMMLGIILTVVGFTGLALPSEPS